MSNLTKLELQEFFKKKVQLETNEQTLYGLREYASKSKDPRLQMGIQQLENAVAALNLEIDEASNAVLETLSAVEPDSARIVLMLHYYEGYSWKMVTEILGIKSEHAIRSLALRSLNAYLK